MIKKRIGTDLFLKFAITENGAAADLSAATNLKLTIKREGSSKRIDQTFTRTDNVLAFQWSSVENTTVGVFNATIEYDKSSTASETGYIHYAVDFLSAFEVVSYSTQEDYAETTLTGETVQYGADGLSAYQIAVKHGYVGTEEEWVNEIKGDKGDKGDTGAIGPQGPIGLKARKELPAKQERLEQPDHKARKVYKERKAKRATKEIKATLERKARKVYKERKAKRATKEIKATLERKARKVYKERKAKRATKEIKATLERKARKVYKERKAKRATKEIKATLEQPERLALVRQWYRRLELQPQT
jgi:predicted pyridoxine 5'-phosphate oxidase superfamily flavin-nucleotide-binding protein